VRRRFQVAAIEHNAGIARPSNTGHLGCEIRPAHHRARFRASAATTPGPHATSSTERPAPTSADSAGAEMNGPVEVVKDYSQTCAARSQA
jgi:hypothetical protein